MTIFLKFVPFLVILITPSFIRDSYDIHSAGHFSQEEKKRAMGRSESCNSREWQRLAISPSTNHFNGFLQCGQSQSAAHICVFDGGRESAQSYPHEENNNAAGNLLLVFSRAYYEEQLSSNIHDESIGQRRNEKDEAGRERNNESTVNIGLYVTVLTTSVTVMTLYYGDNVINTAGSIRLSSRPEVQPFTIDILLLALRQWTSRSIDHQISGQVFCFQIDSLPSSSKCKLQICRTCSANSRCPSCAESGFAKWDNKGSCFSCETNSEACKSWITQNSTHKCTNPRNVELSSSVHQELSLCRFSEGKLAYSHKPQAILTPENSGNQALNFVIILLIISRLMIKQDRDSDTEKRSLMHSIFSSDGRMDDCRKKPHHRKKSDLDILSEIISPPWRADAAFTCLLSKLARQVSVVVRPQTRFLPDTTNNPALDLAHVGYRLATLSALPPSVPVSRIQLADAGFYYRGQGDELICYKCQKRYSGWTSQDKPMEVHRRISSDCPHIVEREREQWVIDRHDPMASAPSAVPQPQESRRTEAASPLQGASNSQREINVEDGEMANSRPSVPAPSAVHETPIGAAESGVTAGAREARPVPLSGAQETMPPGPSNSPSQQPSCSSLGPPAGENSAGSNQARSTPAGYRPGLLGGAAGSAGGETPGPGSQPRQMFPRAGLDLGGAVYPMYQDMASRRRSFPHWDERRAPPLDQLILCGMFYAGYADCVRCFYCGVGLKHWEANDDVWEEHVRWRPSCGYLRAVKGDDYIRRTLARLGREAGGETEDEPPRQNRHEGDHAGPRDPAQPRRQESPERQALPCRPPSGHTVRTASNTISSSAPSRAPAGNVSTQAATSTPTNAAARTTSSSSSSNTTSSTAASSSESSSNQNGARPEGGIASVAPRDETPSQRVARLQAENRELTRRLRCKVCLQEPIDTILMPCGHLVVCETCARNVTQCPLCRERIRATARVHMN